MISFWGREYKSIPVTFYTVSDTQFLDYPMLATTTKLWKAAINEVMCTILYNENSISITDVGLFWVK